MGDRIIEVLEDAPDGQTALNELGMTRGDEDSLRDYLIEEHKAVIESQERARAERMWRRWRRQREIRPAQETKSWPWSGAANVSVGLAASKTQAATALLKSSLLEREPFWDARPIGRMTSRLERQARSLTDFFQALHDAPQHLNMPRVHHQILYETASLGWRPTKVVWDVNRKVFKARDSLGALQQVTRVASQGPRVVPVRLEDFLIRAHFDDIQRAPWITHRLRFTEHEVKQRVAMGMWSSEAAETLLENPIMYEERSRQEEARRHGNILETINTGLFEVRETRVFRDIDDDGFAEDLVILWEPHMGGFLAIDINDLGRRTVHNFRYIPVPDRIDGIGVGWLVDGMQEEVDTLHNQRIDTAVMSGFQMLATTRGSGISYDEELGPGHILFLDNIANIKEIRLSAPWPQSLEAEQVAKMYADMATGLPDIQSGMADQILKTRDTFRGQATRLAKGSEVFFQTIAAETSSTYADLAMSILVQLARHRDRVPAMLESFDETVRRDVMDVLDIPVADLPGALNFSVRITDADRTDQMRQQSALMGTQLFANYAQQAMQLLPLLQDNPAMTQLLPNVQEFAAQAFVGGTKMLKVAMETMKFDEIGAYLPDTAAMEAVLELQDDRRSRIAAAVNEARDNAAGSGGAGGAGAPSGMGPAGGAGAAPEAPVGGESGSGGERLPGGL